MREKRKSLYAAIQNVDH